MNMIYGIYYPDEGHIFVNGKEVTIRSPKDSYELGIGMVHQHFKLVDVLTAAENIVLGLPGKGKLDMKKITEDIQKLADKYGFELDLSQKIYEMSVSQKQTVEIIKMLYRGARILILDEPTTSLNNDEVEHLFQIIRRLKEKGTAFIFISHKMPEIFRIADRYTVLRNGEFIKKRKALRNYTGRGNWSDGWREIFTSGGLPEKGAGRKRSGVKWAVRTWIFQCKSYSKKRQYCRSDRTARIRKQRTASGTFRSSTGDRRKFESFWKRMQNT